MFSFQNIQTFRAFRSRNYALFFAGQSVSLIGTWMQRTAVSWVVYSMTHSELMLGVTVFAGQFPSFLLSLYGGILSDRYDRYKILLITQLLSMLQSILLAVLMLTHHAEVWSILALSVVLGIVNAFDMPARQPLVHQLITDKDDLPNAVALNASMVNMARLVGPALSGIVLLRFGSGICFLVNALSFIAVLTSLLFMKLPPFTPPAVRRSALTELKEGFFYISHTPAIGRILLMVILMSLLVLPYDTLLPVFAKDIFHGDADTFGYIRSFIGIGAVAGAIFLASQRTGSDLKVILLINTIVLGIGLMLFAYSGLFSVAMLFAVFTGWGTMSQNAICNTIIQVNSAPGMRGRAISFYTMAIFGMLPLGSLVVGAVSERIGAPDTLLIQGVIALVLVAAFSGYLLKDYRQRTVTQGS